MPFTWAFEPAVHTCYRPLPQLFLDNPEVPINWHWGAPLLQMLNWEYPEVINLIKEGMNTGQFKILGSSYSQNVMYNNSEWMNDEQIKFNREVIEQILDGHYPRGFWNSERVWDEKLAPLLIANGYRYTLVENPIINPQIPYAAHHLYKRSYQIDNKTHELHILPDSRRILKLVDAAVWHNDFDSLFTYIEQYSDPDKADTVFVYAQDAEASGFWQYGRGMPYEKAYDNLISLIHRMQDTDWLEIRHLEDVINHHPAIDLDHINTGAADWMDSSVRADGFDSYFEYAERAPELEYFHPLMHETEQIFTKKPKHNPGIFDELKRSALSFTFEYGCAPGHLGADKVGRYLMNVPGKMTLEGLKLTKYLEKIREIGPEELTMKWIQSPTGNPLAFYNNERFASLWTHFGGRCIVLLDWKRDTIISPNIPFYNCEGQMNQLFRYNPPFVFPDFQKTMHYGGNLFEDKIKVDGKFIGSKKSRKIIYNRVDRDDVISPVVADSYFSSQIIPFFKIMRFWHTNPKLVVQKEIMQKANKLEVAYTYYNPSSLPVFIESSTSSTFSPNSWGIMNNYQYLFANNDGEIKLNDELICKITPSEGIRSISDSMFGKRFVNVVHRTLRPAQKYNVTYTIELF
jgi:hypothetical protein